MRKGISTQVCSKRRKMFLNLRKWVKKQGEIRDFFRVFRVFFMEKSGKFGFFHAFS
jgi:hypothetical protein